MRFRLWCASVAAALCVAWPSRAPAQAAGGRLSGAGTTVVESGTEQQALEIGKGTAAISGAIVDGSSGKPIPGAVVAITGGPAGAVPGQMRGVRLIADEQGRFVFTQLPAGSYLLSASKFGYFDGGYGRRTSGTPARRINLVDGQWFRDAKIELRRPSAISGTVVDEAGEPLVGVLVRANTEVFVAGTRQIASGPIVETDDRGIYRFGQLTPGKYIVTVLSVQHAVPAATSLYDLSGTTPQAVASAEAAGRPARLRRDPALPLDAAHRLILGPYPAPPPTASGRSQAYPLTFYAAARTIDDADPVELRAGDDRQGVDFQLRPVPTFRVSGRLDAPAEAYSGMTLRLMPAGSERLGQGNEAATSLVAGDGSFTFLNVPDGSYVLLASRAVSEYRFRAAFTVGGELPVPPAYRMSSMTSSAVFSGPAGTSFTHYATEGSQNYHGRRRVDVAGRDVSDVIVPLTTGVTLSGRLVYEFAKPRESPIGALGLLRAEPANGDPSLGQPRWMRDNTTPADEFTIEGLQSGEYLLRPLGGAIIKSITWKGRDHTFTPFDASAGGDIAGVVITLTDQPTRITGVVRDDTGAPAADAAVISFPAERAQWRNYGMQPARLRATPASTTGAFTLTLLPAGDYMLVAVDDELIDGWKDPVFLEAAARVATRISIGWGETKSQDLVVQRVK